MKNLFELHIQFDLKRERLRGVAAERGEEETRRRRTGKNRESERKEKC